MNMSFKAALCAAALTLSSHTFAQITLYEHDGWRGRAVTIDDEVEDFSRIGFNDRASSVVVDHGEWEVCEHAGFRGRCMVLRKGSYESLRGMDMNDRISSVRRVHHRDRYENEAPAPLPEPTYEYRRRPREDVDEATVTSVRAVVTQSGQRCWTEHQKTTTSNRNDNIGGAIAGAIIGGVLGHQIGNGHGRDIATAGGAVAGAAIGSNVNNQGNEGYGRDVRRCENTGERTPEYWDVTYNYRGIEHRVQMSAPPGPTIAVNRNGEPRQ